MSEANNSTFECGMKAEPVSDSAFELQKTCLMEAPQFNGLSDQELADLFDIPRYSTTSKQERDYVVAALLLRGKHLTERTLRRILKNWTPFGDLPLLDFLRRKQVLPEETLSHIEQKATEQLQSLNAAVSSTDWLSPARRTSRVFERIDPSGRIAKLFGVSQIPKGVTGSGSRTFQAQFRLLRKLGQGGLGAVWLAIDTSLNRYVAVKEIIGDAGGAGNFAAMARFRREAEITGRLEHPSIVPIHLFGQNEKDGRCFYVMRFLGNETLEDAIRDYHERREVGQEKPLAFRKLVTAFVSVCEAIAYAHSRGVVHRDLKPQNIALDNFGQVIVLDWGLAKIMGMEDPQSHLLNGSQTGGIDLLDVTLAGQVTGTPMFMAPEQAAGRIDEIDERTDVYGLGAILYAILTGYAPHELSNESLAAGSHMSALLDAIVDQPSAAPRALNSQVPPALEAICLKAMHRDRFQRYRAVAALSEDLQRWLADEPVTAFQESHAKRTYRWLQKHRALSRFIGASLSVLLVTGLILGILSYQRYLSAKHLDLQMALAETQELRSRLTHAVEAQRESTRFMARVPPLQGIVNAQQKRPGEDESVWSERLRRTFNGLLEVNPNYTAITFWTFPNGTATPTVRVESSEFQRRVARTDLQALANRHLPAIKALERGDIYVSQPGYMGPTNNTPDAKSPVANSRGAGHDLVSGIGVYDEQTKALAGCVTIECDLETVLRNHYRRHDQIRKLELFLTDPQGHATMRFTRKRGLYPIDPSQEALQLPEALVEFFDPRNTNEIAAVSSELSAARVPLKRDDPDRFMGVIVHFDK